MSKPKIKLTCYNGPNGSHPVTPFEFIQTGITGIGQASSFKVQFNINIPPVEGSIFVDPKNEGIAIVELDGHFMLIDGWAVLDPDGSSTVGNPTNPDKINESVEIQRTIMSNKKIKFNVKRKEGGFDKGNITVTFFVSYKIAI